MKPTLTRDIVKL